MVPGVTDFETMWANEFLSIVHDDAPIAVWRHAEPGEPVRYALDVPEGEPVPVSRMRAALAVVPDDAAVFIVAPRASGEWLADPDDDGGHAVIAVD